MTPSDIDRLQTYLRKLFKTDLINVVPPMRKGLSVELSVNEEIVGTVHKDVDDGETSYAITIMVLEEDLPAAPKPPPAKAPTPKAPVAKTPAAKTPAAKTPAAKPKVTTRR